MGMSYKGYGRGKLLLFGEHAAVMGYPALGLSLARGIAIELEPDPAATRWQLEDYDEREGEVARAVMRRIDETIPELPRGGWIRVESDLPEGRGFGSSAALCVALAEAALRAAGQPEVLRHRSLVWSIAHYAEGHFHGSPSGIDTGLAALGGVIAFTPKPPELPAWRRIEPQPLHLLVGSVERRGRSKELIANIRKRARRASSEEALILARLGSISRSAEGLLAGGGTGGLPDTEGAAGGLTAELGALAKKAQKGLAALGLAEPAQSALIALGEAAGSPGGKMSGAGGGGAFWLIYDEKAEAEAAKTLIAARAEELGIGEGLGLETLETVG
ncbi:MAG TPA: hypothetical protein VMV44_02480 [Rectinemataceae bacterium]|nr:hypothetical protein [Rectinemataceae bacterium]